MLHLLEVQLHLVQKQKARIVPRLLRTRHRYSFPLVQYKYCLFADIPVQMDMYPEDDSSGLFRFSMSDVAEQSIDFEEWCSSFRRVRRDLDVSM